MLRLVREIKPNYKLCHHGGRGMYYSVDPASSLASKSHKLAFVGRHKCTQTMFGLDISELEFNYIDISN